jgi:hypothetical protein
MDTFDRLHIDMFRYVNTSSRSTFYKYVSLWQEFNKMVGALHRCAELKALMVWGKRKKAYGPLAVYAGRLMDEEMRIARFAMRSPRLFFWARLAQRINRLVTSEPKYKPRGSAAKYRYKYYDVE